MPHKKHVLSLTYHEAWGLEVDISARRRHFRSTFKSKHFTSTVLQHSMPIKIEKQTKFPWEKFLMEEIPKMISSSLEIFQAADHNQFTYMNIISKKGAKVTKSRSWSIAYAFLDG